MPLSRQPFLFYQQAIYSVMACRGIERIIYLPLTVVILRERARHPYGVESAEDGCFAATGFFEQSHIFIMPPEMELLIKYEKDMFLDCFSSLTIMWM